MSKKTAEEDESLGSTLKTIIFAMLIALFVRTFAFEPFNIPSSSMVPSLLVGDFLFVSKYSYGYSKLSILNGFPLFDGRILSTPPQRGDVVVFKLPTDEHTDYIKRLIGLPGDRVQVIHGILHINGEAVKREVVGKVRFERSGGQLAEAIHYLETLPNGKVHDIYEEGDDRPLDNTPVYTVPPRHYFMMGDNRDNSQDSRVMSKVGFVPEENLVGRAEIIFFSLDDDTHFWEFWKWPWDVRGHRLFMRIN